MMYTSVGTPSSLTRSRSRASRWGFAVAAAIGAATLAVAQPSGGASALATLDGAGSTWSQIAVDQWRADVARQGLVVNFQGVGSTAGRVAYYQNQVDFAVSEIPFQPPIVDRTGNTSSDELALAARRPYAYMPIVAGGTAFMYNLSAGGQRITDLKLAPATLAKIFTGSIRNWNDPAIAADNPGRTLPATRIKPVIRSDGSGTSAQFTAFMKAETPSEWSTLCQRANLGANCPATSLYPDFADSGFAAQQFSDGVANFVAAPYNDGAITYVEYGYAKERGFPVASVRNVSGQFVQPTALNVAIALQGATINRDGTQVLTGVYRNTDPRAYPVSSYSYMIVPTSTATPFSTEKGEVLSRFAYYFLCAGQQKAEQLGYSPLPRNLVQFAFDAVVKVPGALAPPAINTCANPTITGEFITPPPTTPPATTAPPNGTTPPGDQNPGAGDQGGAQGGGVPGAGDQGGGVPAGGGQGGGQGDGGRGGGGAGGGGQGGGGAGGDVTGDGSADGLPSVVGGSSAGGVDPVTGQPMVAAAVSVELPETSGSGVPGIVYVVIVGLVLAAAFAPAFLMSRRRESTT